MDSRWEAHSAATGAILESFSEIVDALDSVAEDQSQKGETVREAASIAGKMQELEFVLMLVVWHEMLQKFHEQVKHFKRKNLLLQCVEISIRVWQFI